MTNGSCTIINAGGRTRTTHFFIAKYRSASSLVWASSIGDTYNDFVGGISVASRALYGERSFFSPSKVVGSLTFADPFSLLTVNNQHRGTYFAKFSALRTPLWPESHNEIGAPIWDADGHHGYEFSGTFAIALAHDDFGSVYLTGGFTETAISFGTTTFTGRFPDAVPASALFLVR
jgi:hypothetical protein